MNTLIEDLLRLAREGERLGETQPVDAGDLIQACWRNVETANSTLVAEFEETIMTDPTRFKQLLENLVRNAVEHGGDGVTVTIGRLEDGFYIADNGPGIDDANIDAIFDVGYTTTPDGTGFGLNIVRRVVDAHDWELSVTESADGGARFEITGVEFAT